MKLDYQNKQFCLLSMKLNFYDCVCCRVNVDRSHLKYDICKHYDVTKLKQEIMKDMAHNLTRVEKADQQNDV